MDYKKIRDAIFNTDVLRECYRLTLFLSLVQILIFTSQAHQSMFFVMSLAYYPMSKACDDTHQIARFLNFCFQYATEAEKAQVLSELFSGPAQKGKTK